MERTVHITISKIVKSWGHPDLCGLDRAGSRRELFRCLLPDAYDAELCTDSSALFLREKGDTASLLTPALRMLYQGNRRSLSGAVDRLGSTTFTEDLVDKLNRNIPVRYRAGKARYPAPFRENLLAKLHALVQTSDPPLTVGSPLFARNPLEPDYPDGPGAEGYRNLKRLRRELLETGGIRAVTWAVLITVLAGWTQWRVAELRWLWDREIVAEYLSRPDGEPERRGLELHVPFDRTSYMHEYRIHLYRSTTRELFPLGTLTMTAEPPGICMDLRYSLSDRPENLEGRWRYTGTPMLSPKDSMVYAVMADERSGSTAILSFHFTDFRSGDMYFRTGLLMSAHPLTKLPQQQKVAITRGPLTPEQEALVRGVLTLGEEVELTKNQLDAFLEDHGDAAWMPKFRERLLPFLELHEEHCYRFGTGEVMEYSLSGLGSEERLKIALLLRSCAARTEDDGRLFVRAQEPENLHKLMK